LMSPARTPVGHAIPPQTIPTNAHCFQDMPRHLNLKDESKCLMPGIGLRLARFWAFLMNR
jgi:hypothetical protein